ncbi:MAG: winged helix-turn-helix transcriptional regulator [Pseudonocardiaceae bacterium]
MSDSSKLSDHKTVTTDPGGTDNPHDLVLPAHTAVLFAALHRRWALHLLYLLGQRPARFTELQRTIPGISAMSLNERLRALVDAGLVARHVFPGPPMSSIYQATATGRLIGEHLIRMAADTQGHQPAGI